MLLRFRYYLFLVILVVGNETKGVAEVVYTLDGAKAVARDNCVHFAANKHTEVFDALKCNHIACRDCGRQSSLSSFLSCRFQP